MFSSSNYYKDISLVQELFQTFAYKCLEKSLLLWWISLVNSLLHKIYVFHKSSDWHTQSGCVPSFHGCGWPFYMGLCFLNMLNCFHYWLLQLFFFLLVSNIIFFPSVSILEHMFFNYFTSCGNIHIYNDYLCLSNRLNLYYCHRCPMKHLLHLSEIWTIYHFMSIQTIDVACIRRCLLWCLTWCYLYGCHYGPLFFMHVSTLWFIIPQFV